MNSLVIDTKINAGQVVSGAKNIIKALGNVAKSAMNCAKSAKATKKSLGKMVADQALIKSLAAAALAIKAISATLKAMIAGIKEGFRYLAQWNDGNNDVNKSITNIRTELLRMKNALATALAPILQALEPAITRLIALFADAATKVGMFFAALRGQSTFVKAVAVTDDYAKSLKKTGAAAKSAKKQLAGIYDLNNLSRNDDSGSGASTNLDPNQMFEEVQIDSKLAILGQKIKTFVETGRNMIASLWKAFTESWFVQDMIARWDTIKTAFGNLVTKLKDIFAGFVDKIAARKETFAKIFDVLFGIVQVFAIKWQIIIQFIIGAIAPLVEAISNIVVHIVDIIGGLIDFVAGVFTGDWERAWNGIKDVFKGIINIIIDIFEGVINTIVGGLNALNVDIPEWVPLAGGKNIGFHLNEVHWPRLATGTVVPRQSREFAAILGDNNRETEVVSPLSTMKQAMLEALNEANIGGGNNNVTVVLEGDAAGIFRIVRTEEEKNYERTGNLAFVH